MAESYDDMAKELLVQAGIFAQTSTEARAKVSAFLKQAFAEKDRELSGLRKWKQDWMPTVVDWSDKH